jgi:hypothetical protein
VVALKPRFWRGDREVLREKQERRGGIETRIRRFWISRTISEAGTPWWH